MTVSYKKLWHLLIDRDMNKQDLGRLAKISSTSIAKLSKGANIGTDIIDRICCSLGCNVADIMDIVPEKNSKLSHQYISDESSLQCKNNEVCNMQTQNIEWKES